ncbi:hypothetical protein EXW34_06670 [Bacillus mycoides]|uniref:hypothetical protein n=1 Tax=Bacillus mycoides TaxID=1405 RepID=UPI0002799898|nr:hypothetical protein [Bacillus mycoides]EJS10525.1 hypothetical protein IKO_00746 [Bacillus cereus VDM034]QWI21038.1 hypothetical protein EXW34_06670 [Bacillus mycoides]
MSNNQSDNSKNKNVYTKDDSYLNLDRVNFWINNCDTKASFVFAFLGIFIGVLFTSDYIYDNLKKMGSLLLALKSADFKNLIAIATLISLGGFLFYFIKSGKNILDTLTPRILPSEFEEQGLKTGSNLNFQSIDSKGFEQHFNEVSSMASEKNLLLDIESQVFINSKIATRKFTTFKSALNNTKICLIFLAVFLILGTLLRVS